MYAKSEIRVREVAKNILYSENHGDKDQRTLQTCVHDKKILASESQTHCLSKDWKKRRTQLRVINFVDRLATQSTLNVSHKSNAQSIPGQSWNK